MEEDLVGLISTIVVRFVYCCYPFCLVCNSVLVSALAAGIPTLVSETSCRNWRRS